MPYRNLSTFVSFLESKKLLHRIKAEVDPVLEITEIANRTFQNQGPALLFERVHGSEFPVVINTLATPERLNEALGQPPQEVGQELKKLAESLMPPSIKGLWAQRASLKRIIHMKPKHIFPAPVLGHCIDPADLDLLPVAQTWPLDGGKFFTFPLVITKNPIDGRQNMGVYRLHKYDKTTTGMHWQISKGGGIHYQLAEATNKPLSVCVAIGADPILMLCGVLPLPEGLDELSFAGFLRKEATRVTRMGTHQILVPAEADFILEGVVPPFERRREGPYGDHFGHYSLAADFPVFHVQRLWHRTGAIFPISVVGKPPQEDQVIGDAVQEMLLPLLKIMRPEIEDLWAYMQAGFHNLCVVSVRQRFEKEAIKTALWILGEGQLALTKVVIVVDPDVNARQFSQVLRAIKENFDPARDFILLPSTSQDTLDFTGPKMNLGSKMILDATKKGKSHQPKLERNISSRVKDVVPNVLDSALFEDCLLAFQIRDNGRTALEKLVQSTDFSELKIIVALSPDVPLDHSTLFLWGLFTRFDCARDTFFKHVSLSSGHSRYEGPLCIDATWKPGYPEPLCMTDDIIRRVDQRWKEYGF